MFLFLTLTSNTKCIRTNNDGNFQFKPYPSYTKLLFRFLFFFESIFCFFFSSKYFVRVLCNNERNEVSLFSTANFLSGGTIPVISLKYAIVIIYAFRKQDLHANDRCIVEIVLLHGLIRRQRQITKYVHTTFGKFICTRKLYM